MSKQLKMDRRNIRRRELYAKRKLDEARFKAARDTYYDDVAISLGLEPESGEVPKFFAHQVSEAETLQVSAQTVALVDGWPNNISTANYHNELAEHDELFFPVGFFTRIKNRIKDWFNAGKRH